MLCVESGEGGQERRVDVEDPVGKLADEAPAEDAHEAREADELNVNVAQLGDQLAIVNLPIETKRRRQRDCFQSPLLSGCAKARGAGVV